MALEHRARYSEVAEAAQLHDPNATRSLGWDAMTGRRRSRDEEAGTGRVARQRDGNAVNQPGSAEEAAAITGPIGYLLKGQYFRTDGASGPLKPDEIMVVAPYNAQVRCLRERLPDGVRVGTVDKFQGQEAAVCFFSMATSSGDEIPRNLEFLFSRNRLNVGLRRRARRSDLSRDGRSSRAGDTGGA